MQIWSKSSHKTPFLYFVNVQSTFCLSWPSDQTLGGFPLDKQNVLGENTLDALSLILIFDLACLPVSCVMFFCKNEQQRVTRHLKKTLRH